MSATLHAYRVLLEVARADGAVSVEERELLEDYRQALGVDAVAAGTSSGGVSVEAAQTSPAHNLNLVKMMIRVAFADGRFVERERRRLEEVGRRLGIGRIEYAEAFVAVESEFRSRRRLRRSLIAAVVVFGVALMVIAAILRWPSGDEPALAQELLRLREQMDRLVVDQAERDAVRVRRSLDRGSFTTFQDVEARYGRAVLLIVVVYKLIGSGSESTHWTTGTGFFVSPDGLIVTNKHVVQPWKYSADVASKLAAGQRLDRASLHMAAWPAGAALISDAGEFDLGQAWATQTDTLRMLRTTEDRSEVRAAELEDGSTWVGDLHAMGIGDLAVLQARVDEPVRPFPLPRALPGIAKLDPVMVLGFPRGVALLEDGLAESSAALGQVSKIQESILITAPVVPGNSGGPVVDAEGRVIGVATLSPGEGLGICLQSREFLELLPAAAELIDRARRSLESGRPAAARSFLDIAGLRSPSAEESKTIDELSLRSAD